MANTVKCVVLKEDAEAMEKAPYPGELGQRILENVSKQGWQKWMEHQTMLINEKHLKLFQAEDRKYLEQQMEAFLFGSGADEIDGFTPK